MRIKQRPEDFLVEEIAEHDLVDGPYVLVRMTKRGMTTPDAVGEVCRQLGLPRKNAGYAGLKDRHAVTIQHVSLACDLDHVRKFSHDRISLETVGTLKEPIRLGQLDGNRFTIVVRDIKDEELSAVDRFPNYFDEQRFSTDNAVIGRRIIKQEYEEACKLIMHDDDEFGPKLESYLEGHEHDWVGALQRIPGRILLLYVHAYQSQLYNRMLRHYIRENDPDAEALDGPVKILLPSKELPDATVPLVGFDSSPEEPFASWMHELLDHDHLEQRDFVNRQLPFLTLEGTERDAFVRLQDFHADGPAREDDARSQRLSFVLPPGAYATIAVKCLYRTGELQP